MDRDQPSVPTMFRRAVVLKCPHCGSRHTFIKRWLGRHPRCRSCGIAWHREHGFELGPIAVNVVITFFLLSAGMVVAFIATSPDFPVLQLTVSMIVAAVIIPLIAYPFTYTLWLAFDLAVHRPDARELAEAAAAMQPAPELVEGA
jgi:uncharacterized protein (DUF983 family)